MHITNEASWKKALKLGEYRPDTIATQGFIHCSTSEQYVSVANYIYKGNKDLMLLSIMSSKVKSEIKYEKSGTQFYPHIYGSLNLDAVIKVQKFLPNADGVFEPFPEEKLLP